MKRWLKVSLIVVGVFTLCIILDIVSMYTRKKPILYSNTSWVINQKGEKEQKIYIGLFYNVYDCQEYSTPQIKMKWDNFTCTYFKIKTNEDDGGWYNGYNLVSDLEKIDYASTQILVMFDSVLYGKSNSIIDYAGKTNKIGVIDKLINNKYVPKFNNETNTEEIKNAEVYDRTKNSIVLLYNNEFVLFEKIN